MDVWDPALYERSMVKGLKIPSLWVQVDFVVPEGVRERMTSKQLRQCHGRHVVEIDFIPPIGWIWEYPISETCPTFEWLVVEGRSFPRRKVSKQKRIVSQVKVQFIRMITENENV